MSDIFSGLQSLTFEPEQPGAAMRAVGVEVDGICLAFPVRRFESGDHVLVYEPVLSHLRSVFQVTADLEALPTIRAWSLEPTHGFMDGRAGYGAFWLPAAKTLDFLSVQLAREARGDLTEHGVPAIRTGTLHHPVVRLIVLACSVAAGVPSPLEAVKTSKGKKLTGKIPSTKMLPSKS